jgi:hypothetical protein
MPLCLGLLWLTISLAPIIQWLSQNNIFFDCTYPITFFCVPPNMSSCTPGVSLPQVEDHCSRISIIIIILNGLNKFLFKFSGYSLAHKTDFPPFKQSWKRARSTLTVQKFSFIMGCVSVLVCTFIAQICDVRLVH